MKYIAFDHLKMFCPSNIPMGIILNDPSIKFRLAALPMKKFNGYNVLGMINESTNKRLP